MLRLIGLTALATLGVACSLVNSLDSLSENAGAGTGGNAAGGGAAGAAPDSGSGGSSTQCEPGKKPCGDACVSLEDPATGCGGPSCEPCNPPNAQALCIGGACALGQCGNGFEDCNGLSDDGCETNTKTSATDCGACFASCAIPHRQVSCVSGACQPGACDAGYADCNSDLADGCETNISADPTQCGSCGNACPFPSGKSATCDNGVCGVSNCVAPLADCDKDASETCETDVSSSTANCGYCGGGCSYANAAATCNAGTCALASCQSGYGNCDGNAANGCETNVAASLANCGTCGNACSGGANASPTCTSGSCGFKCETGFGNCDGNAGNGCETNVSTSTQHCGACGNSCGAQNGTPSCGPGGCTVACNAGFGNCDASAGNGCETPLNTNSNCGTCGKVIGLSGNAGGGWFSVTGGGGKLSFSHCDEYGCVNQDIVLQGFTASGSAGTAQTIAGAGNKLNFTQCDEYGCSTSSITLSGATVSGSVPGYASSVSASGNKLTFTVCDEYGCSNNQLTFNCG